MKRAEGRSHRWFLSIPILLHHVTQWIEPTDSSDDCRKQIGTLGHGAAHGDSAGGAAAVYFLGTEILANRSNKQLRR